MIITFVAVQASKLHRTQYIQVAIRWKLTLYEVISGYRYFDTQTLLRKNYHPPLTWPIQPGVRSNAF